MYFLNKREIAHTTNFSPLCELGKSLGVKYLEDLQRGGNAHYTSERFKQELSMFQCLLFSLIWKLYFRNEISLF